ncbi:MAG: hypothetical protein RL266_1969, partial [Bacteroidota bacterium]
MASIHKKDREGLIKDLKSNEETAALKAVEKLQKAGDASFIIDILEALNATTEVGIESALSQLLFNLKDKDALEELVNQLVNPSFQDIRI